MEELKTFKIVELIIQCLERTKRVDLMYSRLEKTNLDSLKKSLFILAGTVCLIIGAIGILLPILPTTPFLLLAAACYYKGSERMHRWLLNNKWFGNYIRNYKEGKGISLKAKAFTLSLLWITISYSAFFVTNTLVFQIILLGIALAVSVHVMALPTFRES
jgi:uncharacterized membrane protein YbaN (DUF454 family)